MIMVCSSHATASDFLSKKGLRKTHFWFHCYMWYSCGTALFFNTLILSVRSIIYEPLRTLALKYLSQEQRKAKFHINRCPTIVVKSSMICWKKLTVNIKNVQLKYFTITEAAIGKCTKTANCFITNKDLNLVKISLAKFGEQLIWIKLFLEQT